MNKPDNPPGPASSAGRPSRAFRLGRMAQAVLLALAIAAVVLRLIQNDDALAFRYGGF